MKCPVQTVIFIHPFIENILSTCYVPGPVLGTGAKTFNRNKVSVLVVLITYILVYVYVGKYIIKKK